MRFKIEPKYGNQNQTAYVVTLLGKPNSIYTSILGEIANRPNPSDLEYLLVSPQPLYTARDSDK